VCFMLYVYMVIFLYVLRLCVLMCSYVFVCVRVGFVCPTEEFFFTAGNNNPAYLTGYISLLHFGQCICCLINGSCLLMMNSGLRMILQPPLQAKQLMW
jgi:hypothetical protein